MSEGLAASSQAIAFDSAARCGSGASGPVSPSSAMMIQAASVVWLSLIGGRLSVAKNSHEPSGCCFLTISSAISFRLCFCPSCQRGQRPCGDGQERQPHVQPSTLWARVGWIGRIGKDLRGHQLVPASQQGLGRIRHEFLVDRVPLPSRLRSAPKAASARDGRRRICACSTRRHFRSANIQSRARPSAGPAVVSRRKPRTVRRQGRAVKSKAPGITPPTKMFEP